MIKKSCLILFGLTLWSITNAQEVVTTSGGSMTDNKVQVNWTIGEPITETFTNKNSAVTSGLNQPTSKIETLVEIIESIIDISVFPNPTSQFVKIKYGGQLPISTKILSLNGTFLFVKELKTQPLQLDFSTCESGVYIIEITDKSGKFSTFRIVKQ
jgi:hypothetical protein